MLAEYTNSSNMFGIGQVYPPQSHYDRVQRYKQNKLLFKGFHSEVFHNHNINRQYADTLYVSVDLAGIICKKSADYLFGEDITVTAGVGGETPEQNAINRIINTNYLGILLYESALTSSYAGDSFIKIRYGQEYGGELPPELDEHRVIIENVSPEHVYPETVAWDKNKIRVYHVAVPYYDDSQNKWFLNVESHSTGEIRYCQYSLIPLYYNVAGTVERWEIDGIVEGSSKVVKTGVNAPLIVHIPNYAVSDNWEGIDDITALHPILSEINNRLSQIADILDKHSNPAMAVPTGVLSEDGDGNTEFHVAYSKVFEVLGKDDVIPQYITWDGKLTEAFNELDRLIELALVTSEIPAVVLGRSNVGTSGASGLAIKFMMNSLLAKVNRKRQYYDKGLKQILYIAQKLEDAVGIADYDITVPTIEFHDGLPIDEMEQTNIANIRTGGMATMSQKTAIMRLNGMTEEQAELEIERIKAEQHEHTQTADASIFNAFDEPSLEPLEDNVSDDENPATSESEQMREMIRRISEA